MSSWRGSELAQSVQDLVDERDTLAALNDKLVAELARYEDDVPVSTIAENRGWNTTCVSRGLRLRSLGLTYTAIAIVLSEYHGLNVTEPQVRYVLRKAGATPDPRGEWKKNLKRGCHPATA